jgi:thymidylate kinase
MRREEGLISGAEFAILATAAESEMSRVAPTDVVLLDASPEVCIDRVQRLGDRLGEAKLSRAELAKLRERYRTWFSQLLTPSKVILETDDLTKSQVVDQVIEALGLCSSSGDKRWRSA